jgi:hypothetical protein
MPKLKVTNDILEAALVGLEQQKLEVDARIADIRRKLGGPVESAAPAPGVRRRRRMSRAGRARIAAAQKARWAKLRGESVQASSTASKPARRKRKLSRGRNAAAATKKTAPKRTAAPANGRKKAATATPPEAAA